jgi:hypothetical protein
MQIKLVNNLKYKIPQELFEYKKLTMQFHFYIYSHIQKQNKLNYI